MTTLARFHRRGCCAALAAAACLLALAGAPVRAAQPVPLRVITHDSFDLPQELLAQFEKDAGVTLEIVKGGDTGNLVDKLIHTRDAPVADVVFGLDNASVGRAWRAGILDPVTDRTLTGGGIALPFGAVAVDYGNVTLNIDRAWFLEHKVAPPASLDDLTRPAWRKLLVVENPATSSPGFGFMAATIKGLGEAKAWAWWAHVRANGLKVVDSWSQAYTAEFTRNGGAYPIVVSYAASPAAEVALSKTPVTQAPTVSLELPGGVFKQIEGAALVKGGGSRDAALAFLRFLRSQPVQEALQTSMWMLPVTSDARLSDVMFRHAHLPRHDDAPDAATLAEHGQDWVREWTRVVLK